MAKRFRITSYNVCYTKLLRFKGIPREVAERSALALAFSCGARRWLLGTSRITSYNVCYTKLLRTLTVPKDQTAYGVCDIITHVMEGYFNGVDGTPIQDRFAEGVIINAIEWGRKAVADGSDLFAREQVQWASIVALNGWVQAGVHMVPPMHMIEHALSAHHDITHGAGLAIVGPSYNFV